jgi:hypothetical protein
VGQVGAGSTDHIACMYVDDWGFRICCGPLVISAYDVVLLCQGRWGRGRGALVCSAANSQ